MTLFTATEIPLQLSNDNFLEIGFPIYQSLLNKSSKERMVLFESLGRHSIDARSSLIAMNSVIDMNVYGKRVKITGHTVLIFALKKALCAFTATVSTDEQIEYILDEHQQVWDFLRAFESAFRVEKPNSAAPLALFGYFGYDTIHYIESVKRLRPRSEEVPEISLALYRTVVTIDEHTSTLTHYSYDGDDLFDLDAIKRACETTECTSGYMDMPLPRSNVRYETHRADYLEKCVRAIEHIRIGDVYQIQIGHKVLVETTLSPLDLYSRLRHLNPSPYMYLFSAGGNTIIGASPELFIRIDDDALVMRPIAGTVGKTAGLTRADAELELRSSEKETAEHLMLVDLCRNDICRVCAPESLIVDDLMDIEEYSHVFHMVSSTVGRLLPEHDKYDAICATFPAGTMTGTPKVRAVELIEEMEDSARGQYAGLVGMLGIGTNYLNTALCIRSAVHSGSQYTLRASAGVVSDSVPQSEYRETLQKLGSVYKAITGEELTCAAE